MMKACLVAATAGAVGSASTAARAATPDRAANFCDAIILGAGTAGLVTAVEARRYGARTAFADAAYQRSRRRAARGRRSRRHAADVRETASILWKYHAAAPVVAGVTPTAGGLIFSGDLSGNLLALDARTGTELYKLNTGGAIAGGVITYETGGKQYVATTSGNVSRITFSSTSGSPKVVILTAGLAKDEPRIVAVAEETQHPQHPAR